MNTKNQLKTVLAMSIIIAILSTNMSTVQGHIPNFMPYGEIGQEDQLFFKHHDLYYINTADNLNNDGMFAQVNEINDSFTVNGAQKVFNIADGTTSFIYEPIINGKFMNVLFLYEFDGYDFELTSVHKDVSGINQMITQLENNQ